MHAQIDSLEAANAAQASQLKDISDFMSIVSEGLDSIATQNEEYGMIFHNYYAHILNFKSDGVEVSYVNHSNL